MKCSEPFATPQQNEPPNPNKNYGALENTTQCDLPEVFCYLPALQTKLFLGCMSQGRKHSPIEIKDLYLQILIPRHCACSPAQALKVAIGPVQDHLRAEKHRKRVFVANMTSWRCIRLGPARILHTLTRSKTNTSASHCSPTQALSITPKKRAPRVSPLTSFIGIAMTPRSARAAAWAQRKSLKVKVGI